MCIGGAPKAPKVEPLPAPPAPAPKLADQAVQQAGESQRKRLRAAAGFESTIKAGAGGSLLGSAEIASKSLLGQ